MGHIQIKNVPAETHTELRRRAEQAGLSLRDYLMRLIRRDLALPSIQDWIAEVEALEPVPEGEESAAEMIAAVRRERDEELDQR
jgi:hypothetical protein